MANKTIVPEIQPEPPDDLSESSKTLWSSVIGRCRSPGRREMLYAALLARDRAAQARLEIEETGLTFETKATGAVHVNPLTRVELQNAALFAKLWHQLSLHWDATIDTRP